MPIEWNQQAGQLPIYLPHLGIAVSRIDAEESLVNPLPRA